MKAHVLKLYANYFNDVAHGHKRFEIRKNDRDYQVDDLLILREFVPQFDVYTGNMMVYQVTYMTDFKQRPGYVVLGIENFVE